MAKMTDHSGDQQVAPSPPAADEAVVHMLKPVADRDDTDLVNLVEQLHTRAMRYDTKPLHDAWVEARNELLCRLTQLRRDLAEARKGWTDASAALADYELTKQYWQEDKRELARLRARLAGAETWYVMAGGGDLLPGAGVSRVKPIVESLMQQYHDDRSVVPVLVLPDEPEGLTTDSTNPEPGRGTK